MNMFEAGKRLEGIIDRIDPSIGDDAKLELRQELIEFKHELPWDPEFTEMGRIAQEAFDDLGRSINQSVLNRMSARGKELRKLVETVSAVTGAAEKKIDTLRLKYVQALTGAATDVADVVRQIKASLEINDLPAASEKAEDALNKIMLLISRISTVE